MPETVLQVNHLSTVFDTGEGPATAVDDISFFISRGETLGLVGESGCGKTVTALSILRLIRKPGRIVSGSILLDGVELLNLEESEMQGIRGNDISMIFQEPMTSLNPVFSIGSQITEVYRRHLDTSRSEAKRRTIEILGHVGIPDPAALIDAYPHQLSGGMRQRVLIAMSLACTPKVVIADEPTTAIDVTVQAQILNLIRNLQNEFGMGVLLITHDLGVVAESCDRVAIMYASKIVEDGTIEDIFHRPRHPYTVGLLQSIPAVHDPTERLTIIPGQVPRPSNYPPGCNFYTRCSYASDKCATSEPPHEAVMDGHSSACWNWRNVEFTPHSR